MPTDNSNPMERLRALAERFKGLVEQHGLEVEHINVAPNLEGGPDMMQVIMRLTPSAFMDGADDDVELSDDERALFASLEDGLSQVDSRVVDEEKAAAKNTERLHEVKDWLEDI